jgi:hypothetical protein
MLSPRREPAGLGSARGASALASRAGRSVRSGGGGAGAGDIAGAQTPAPAQTWRRQGALGGLRSVHGRVLRVGAAGFSCEHKRIRSETWNKQHKFSKIKSAARNLPRRLAPQPPHWYTGTPAGSWSTLRHLGHLTWRAPPPPPLVSGIAMSRRGPRTSLARCRSPDRKRPPLVSAFFHFPSTRDGTFAPLCVLLNPCLLCPSFEIELRLLQIDPILARICMRAPRSPSSPSPAPVLAVRGLSAGAGPASPAVCNSW